MPPPPRSIRALHRVVVLAAALAAPLGAAAGCVARGPAGGPRAAPPTPLDAGAYASPGEAVPPTEDVLEGRSAVAWERVLTIPARVPDDLAGIPGASDPIRVRLYLPRAAGVGRRPLVLMSPVLGSSSLLTPTFAEAFARRGWTAALVERKDLEFDPAAPPERAEGEVRLLVLRSRQALDTLLRRPDVDPARLATFGVSAGGIVSALLGAVEPRFTAHVWALAGGPLADVVVDTEEERFVRYVRASSAATGWDREELRRRLRAAIRTDPVALAPHVPRERVLLILARGDASVPTRHGAALYEALGRPALRLIPGGHRTCWLCLPYVRQEATAFLASRFAAAS